jgi:hypothetical protein
MIDSTDPFNSVIKEKSVMIRFSRAPEDRVKLHFTVDFSKTSMSPHNAALAMGEIVAVLRSTMGVSLSEVQV